MNMLSKIFKAVILIAPFLAFFLIDNLYDSYEDASFKNEILVSEIKIYEDIANLKDNDTEKKRELEERVQNLQKLPDKLNPKKPAISYNAFLLIFLILYIISINNTFKLSGKFTGRAKKG